MRGTENGSLSSLVFIFTPLKPQLYSTNKSTTALFLYLSQYTLFSYPDQLYK